MAIPIYNSFKGRQNNVLEQKTTYQNEINVLELRVYLIMNYNGRKYKQKVNRYLFQNSNKLWAEVLTLHSKDFLIPNYDSFVYCNLVHYHKVYILQLKALRKPCYHISLHVFSFVFRFWFSNILLKNFWRFQIYKFWCSFVRWCPCM